MVNKKNFLITLGIIVGTILLGLVIIYIKSLFSCPSPSEEIVECIGEKATLYVNTGCPHCDSQKQKFGECLELLNIVDCSKNGTICSEEGITRIPSWKIDNKLITGVYEVEELQNMTGC